MVRFLMLFVMLTTGTATSQLPEFAQQYRQRLGGAIDALEEILADFRRDAAQYGLSFHQAVARQQASSDPFIQARGISMNSADQRLASLKKQHADLETAGPFQRLVVFIRSMDMELAEATAEDYVPAVPVSAAGFLSAGIGALAGLLIVRMFIGAARLGRSRRQSDL